MKFWLDIPCKDLSREWLLDEHRSLHAYINGMLKDPARWCRHSILGPMNPDVLYVRHNEEVKEMQARGYKHKTPIDIQCLHQISINREHQGLVMPGQIIGPMGNILLKRELRDLQDKYWKEHLEEIKTIEEGLK